MARPAAKALMRILAIWLSKAASRSSSAAGFTLLELLIVLVIVGAVSAMAMPNLLRLQASWTRQVALEDILLQVRKLGAVARAGQAELQITEAGVLPAEALVPPEGWRLYAPQTIRWLDSGVCLGGELTVANAELERRFVLQPPLCQARLAP